ncbi:serine/threonine protein kinase [Nitzschia inconspicua]|uniref:Serine/threonine protein kinase n=1 Tax=Nitzschia inconspicua TaxID=303405 RepID=A0A9K3PMX2_9STRA|nr:serine/threonine protein kinase [Nitzschia inconspicua]
METSSYRSYSKMDHHHRRLLDDMMEVSDKTATAGTEQQSGIVDYNLSFTGNAKTEIFLNDQPANNLSKEKTSTKGSFRRSWSRFGTERRPRGGLSPTSSSSATSGFQRELQQAHRRWERKRNNPEEEKKDEGKVWMQQEPEYFPPTPPGFLPKSNNSPTTVTSFQPPCEIDSDELDITMELQKVRRLLDMERGKSIALKDKLRDTEIQLQAAKKLQPNEYVSKYAHKIRQLQQEVSHYRELWQNEKALRNDVEDKFSSLRQEHAKQEERMEILKFQYLPSVAPRFKDIGVVDYNLQETYHSVGAYQLGGLLGEGYYGSVQVAKRDKTKYACKILKKSRLRRFKDFQQVAIEVHVLQNYRHPGIIQLQDVLHGAENIYLITELCTMDLHKYHNDIGLTEGSAKHVLFGLLDALKHLHNHGISHCDLKPENVLLLTDASGANGIRYTDIRLADFGLVCLAPKPDESLAIHRKGYACGTPGFYAPEMVLESRFEGRQSDMWSLGSILLEVTLGFTSDWIQAYEIADSDPETFRSGLEYSLEEITMIRYPNHKKLVQMIHSCLCIDPEKRITASQALSHPWLEDVASSESKSSVSSQRYTRNSWSHTYEDRETLLNSSAMCQ